MGRPGLLPTLTESVTARKVEEAQRCSNRQLGDDLTNTEDVSILTQRWTSALIDSETSCRLLQACVGDL